MIIEFTSSSRKVQQQLSTKGERSKRGSSPAAFLRSKPQVSRFNLAAAALRAIPHLHNAGSIVS